MSPAQDQPAEHSADGDREAERRRRRRLAEVFGETLPDSTSDERPEAWGDREGGGADEWLRGQVPPHHG